MLFFGTCSGRRPHLPPLPPWTLVGYSSRVCVSCVLPPTLRLTGELVKRGRGPLRITALSDISYNKYALSNCTDTSAWMLQCTDARCRGVVPRVVATNSGSGADGAELATTALSCSGELPHLFLLYFRGSLISKRRRRSVILYRTYLVLLMVHNVDK